MNNTLRLLGLIILAVACSPAPASVDSGVIDFNTLIEVQINELSKRRVTLEKVVKVGESPSDSTSVTAVQAWKSELDIFRQLGMINKSIYQGTYRKEGPLDDPQSNLQIQQHISAASPLKVLRIYYQEDPRRVRKIEGLLAESSALYSSEKNLTMEFDEEDGKSVLIKYSIGGFQKVALWDTVRFYVASTIIR